MTDMEIALLRSAVKGGVSEALNAKEGVECRCSNCEHSCDALTGRRTGKCGLRSPVIGEDGRCMSRVSLGGRQLVQKLANALERLRCPSVVNCVLPTEFERDVRKLLAEVDSFHGHGEEGDEESGKQQHKEKF